MSGGLWAGQGCSSTSLRTLRSSLAWECRGIGGDLVWLWLGDEVTPVSRGTLGGPGWGPPGNGAPSCAFPVLLAPGCSAELHVQLAGSDSQMSPCSVGRRVGCWSPVTTADSSSSTGDVCCRHKMRIIETKLCLVSLFSNTGRVFPLLLACLDPAVAGSLRNVLVWARRESSALREPSGSLFLTPDGAGGLCTGKGVGWVSQG